MKELDLNNEKLCVLAALLGNYLLREEDLKDVYKTANIDMLSEVYNKFVKRNCTRLK